MTVGHALQGTKMNLKSLLLATALVCGVPVVATAQDAATTSVNFGVASSYQFRGVNQNASDDMQIFGGLDISAGSFYVGTWLSNMDFDTKANLEVDVYAGFKPKLGPVQLDLGVLGYFYPQEKDLRIFEAKAAATVANEAGMSLTGSVFYSPEAGKDGPSYWYGELAAAAAIPGAKIGPFAMSVNAAVGTASYENNLVYPDYANWKVGVTAATESGWAVDLFYTDTDVSDNVLYEGKTVLQLKRTF
jgi:uncharacterized protein (TIGR02001 family)